MNTIPTHHIVKHQAGLSLVELMISLTIGLVLLLGLTSLIVQQSGSRDELEKSSRQIENGRYAIQILHDDIEHAGFFGGYSPASGVTYTVPADPCNVTFGSTNSGWATTPAVPVPIYGYPGGLTNPTTATTCGLSNYQPNTPILVVRRTATPTPTPILAATATAGVTYFQVSQCNTATIPFALGLTSVASFNLQNKDCATPAPLLPYLINVYYLSTCDTCTPASDNIPTLKMVQIGGASAVTSPLVEGIENMRLDYGIDTDGDGYPDKYTTTPPTANWSNVMAVRVSLMARNIECTTGYTDTKSYDLGGGSAPASALTNNCATGSGYKRHVYTELVRANNPSGRRAGQ